MKAFKVAAFSAILTLAAVSAEAYPILQLDILGGHYDAATQTIVSDGPDFTLVALLTPQGNHSAEELLDDTYFISAALSPNPGPAGGSLGAFSWNTVNYNVTDSMTYGTPPADFDGGASDAQDLQSHGVFPTFFREFSFSFSESNRTVSYNSEDNPGGLTPSATGGTYFATFNVTTALANSSTLHFDLYNTTVSLCGRNQGCLLDRDAALNAPFSHDAESSPQRVSEPGSILSMAVGLLFAARMLSAKKA